MLYPFLFMVHDPAKDSNSIGSGDNIQPLHWVVIIALTDSIHSDTRWVHKNDAVLPDGHTLKPDIDLTQSAHIFHSERQALEFIKKWWADLDLDVEVTAADLLDKEEDEIGTKEN